MFLLSNISLIALVGYLVVHIIILIVSSIHFNCKTSNASQSDIDLDDGMPQLSIQLQNSSYGTVKAQSSDTIHGTNEMKETNEMHETCETNEMKETNEFITDDQYDKQSLFCHKYGIYLELLLYFMTQSTVFASLFVYISQSKCNYITTNNFDIYYILFALTVLNFVFYKIISSISILIITGNCKYFIMQIFDVLIMYYPIKEIKNNKRKLWLQQYIQSVHSIFQSLPQLIISSVFLFNQMNNNRFNDIIIWSCVVTCLYSITYFSGCNYKKSYNLSLALYTCRFLQITSRICMIILIWKYFGALFLTIVVFLEFIYLLICAISSHNLLLIGNILYAIIDVYGYKKSKIFIGYRIVTNYLYGIVIGLLIFTNCLNFIYKHAQNLFDTNENVLIFNVFQRANYNNMTYDIPEIYWIYVYIYSMSIQLLYEIFIFCKYKPYISSIGQCNNFGQLFNYKCYEILQELMELGIKYNEFDKYNENNLLNKICSETNVELIHLKIAKLYLDSHNCIFIAEGDNKFYLPFFNAIQVSSIEMIKLLILYGANIEHLFENEDWCNALQCLVLSPNSNTMNKIEFIINLMKSKYKNDKDKILSFLNYQTGFNYDTALLQLYRTNDYKMMDLGFDRLDAMEYLIENGAAIDILDKNKCNILHYATQHKEWRLIRMLVKNDGDINICNNYGQTPLSIACQVGCDDINIIKLLLPSNDKNPNEINKCDTYGHTVMHYAVSNCNYEIISYLIDSNGDCLIEDNNGLTPLHYAIRNNINNTLQIDIIILLVVVGKSNVNNCDHTNISILHDAAKYQSIDIIDLIFKFGANIYNLDNNGHTPKIYSFGRNDQQELMKYWKNIYLNNYIYKEIMSNYNNKNKNISDNDTSDVEVSELSNIDHLQAFQSIISDEMQVDLINR